jgi:hypothetical protein
MTSVLDSPHYHDESAAYCYVEGLLWPTGPVCPHCGNADAAKLGINDAQRTGMAVAGARGKRLQYKTAH